MALGDYEQRIWDEFEQSINLSPELETSARLDVLRDAERVSFAELKDPFSSQTRLLFPHTSMLIRFMPWSNEERPFTDRPAIAEVVQTGAKILIDGASIEGTSREEDRATFARNCDISYRWLIESDSKDIESLYVEGQYMGQSTDEVKAWIDMKVEDCFARIEGDKFIPVRAQSKNRLIGPLSQILQTDEDLPVFQQTD